MYTTKDKAFSAAAQQSVDRNTDISVVSTSSDNFVLYAETNPDLYEGEILECVFRNGEELDWEEVYI